mmetsp:Transcript_102563/g.299202  ORF Transcript_102563/g.299202 Transcript_102563/m.299202 type:complete len:315 (-) Transcript_102563:60-1004(-)
MLQGLKASFHRSSVAYLNVQDTRYANEPVKVLGFDTGKARWIVELVHDRFEQESKLVKEESLSLAYCLLPQNATPSSIVEAVGIFEQVGRCGRGLIAGGSCKLGAVVFEEYPFLISAADEKSSWRGRSRWHAYFVMAEAAARDDGMRHALESFEHLLPGSPPPERDKEVWKEAELLQARSRSKNPQMVQATRDILCIWQNNQFSFDNGSGVKASALFKQACLLNHSCLPTVKLVCHVNHGLPGTEDLKSGRVVVTGLQDLEAGDQLCHNYGPPELLDWPLERRRRFFREVYGFTCCCVRCEAEEAAGVCLSEMD